MFLACEQQMSCWPLTQEDTHEGLSHAYSTLGNTVQPTFPPPRGKKKEKNQGFVQRQSVSFENKNLSLTG